MKLGFGYNPCPDDAEGTHSLDEVLGAAPTSPPKTLDLTAIIGRVRMQLTYGTCVGFGLARAIQNFKRLQGTPDWREISALSIYVPAKFMDGTGESPEDGTSIDAGIKAVSFGGYGFEEELPYTQENIDRRTEPIALGILQTDLIRYGVLAHRIREKGAALWETVRTLRASGKSVTGGWALDDSFLKWNPSQGPWQGMNGKCVGNHCMDVFDFPNENEPRLLSSWGDKMGDKGLWRVTPSVLDQAIALWAIDFVPLS